MISINWNLFKAKFDGKENKEFERLAYHLFCIEHNNKIGIFRFKNQTGIETDPIKTEKGFEGFQAKYYEGKLSGHKDDIIDSIRKAKQKNNHLTHLHLYLNLEVSESSKKHIKEPIFKTEIENTARDLNLELIWRVPSNFEIKLSDPSNSHIAKYFFDNEKTVIDLLNFLEGHTSSLFLSIQTDIVLNNEVIKINRNSEIDSLSKNISSDSVTIISGEGGTGKTALVKDLFVAKNRTIPFYVFKSAEFNLNDINILFRSYGNYIVKDFIEAHSEEKNKIIVFDSSEHISDFENQEPLTNFLSLLIENSWSILFTTRLNYLDDLKFQFLNVFRVKFQDYRIEKISINQLQELSENHSFTIPQNIRMKEILRNLFYLDEYLKFYDNDSAQTDLDQFKRSIWYNKIQNSKNKKSNLHLQRERCFISIVKKKSDEGTFYVQTSVDCTDDALISLQNDEIIGFDNKSGGYFITHDIYEEWGLETIIDRAFNSASSYEFFFKTIGNSLVIRRAFRNWLSEKLYNNSDEIKLFIEQSFINVDIVQHWKDEILTSVLLSEYSEIFFRRFETEISQNNFQYLQKIIFLLRIACKTIDNTLLKAIPDLAKEHPSLIFTKPTGNGWNRTIALVYEKLSLLESQDWKFIVPLLDDWSLSIKKGKTTRLCGLIALHLYKKKEQDSSFYFSSSIEEKIIEIILNCAVEIKNELNQIFDEVLKSDEITNQIPYFDLCDTILNGKANNLAVILSSPKYVTKLANFFWIDEHWMERPFSRSDVESYYGIKDNHDYYPASAYQTPMYNLLRFDFSNAINFLIEFVNKTVENYAHSGFDEDLKTVELNISNEKVIKQYLSHSLWEAYRGSSSPVVPKLLQSLHMALEKYLLESAKNEDAEIIESWLIYLIEKSVSASITAVVTSIALAYPDKLFGVAKIIFSCTEFFHYDNMRVINGERTAKSIVGISSIGYRHKLHYDERVNALNDNHRKNSLENQIVLYQFFSNPGISEEVAESRKQEVWKILDKFNELTPVEEEEDSKVKRLLLARIDRRKMKPEYSQQGDSVVVNLNPQLNEELKEFSQKGLESYNESSKYLALHLWGTQQFKNSEIYGEYPQYDNNPELVLKETKEVEKLVSDSQKSVYIWVYQNIPGFSCSALINKFDTQLSQEDLDYCENIIAQFSLFPFNENYEYQISDGVEASVNTLPKLMKLFPQNNSHYLLILFFLLFDRTPIGAYKRICDYSLETISDHFFTDSHLNLKKILLCFLKYKPLFNNFRQDNKKELANYRNWRGNFHSKAIQKFIEKYDDSLDNFFESDDLIFENVSFEDLSIEDLEIIFQLIPSDSVDDDLLIIVNELIKVFASKLFLQDKYDDKIDYTARHRIYKKLSYFLLSREQNSVAKYFVPFVENFSISDNFNDFLQEIILAENNIKKYDQFWIIWSQIYSLIIENKESRSHYYEKMVKNFLLADIFVRPPDDDWHLLKDREKSFYQNIVDDIGEFPHTLNAMAKFLSQAGYCFIEDGIFWLSEIIRKNKHDNFDASTIYLLENLIKKYIFLNRARIKKTLPLKKNIVGILNYLILSGSVSAYLLREDIL